MPRKHSNTQHPFLLTRGKTIVHKKSIPSNEVQTILYEKSHLTIHHLFPRARTNVPSTYKNHTLRLWSHKHFLGWNTLFQFKYRDDYNTEHFSELTIDEIITCIYMRHPFITLKIGTKAWNIVFKNKTLTEARMLLERFILIKFKRVFQYTFNSHIERAQSKFAA